MVTRRVVRTRAALLTAVLAIGVGLVATAGSSGALVTAVKGSAFGVSAPNITIFGGAQTPYGPTPSVTLPATGSATPITGHDNSELVAYGPATLFESGAVDVSTQGTIGEGGSVTSTSTINSITTANGGQFSADKLEATCTANESGVTGSTTVTNGSVATNTDANGNVTASQTVPTNPAPNTVINGQIVLSATDTETFTDTFNEQTVNPDGSITVTAYHQHLNGPTAKGDVYVGQVTCGVTAVASSTTTTAPTTTTTTAPTTTTTTAPTTTTTTGPTTTTTTGPTTTTTTPFTSIICSVLQRVMNAVPFLRAILARVLALFGCLPTP